MTEDERLFEVFLDVQRGLPRQGPGCDASTLQALSLCAGLPERPHVLDIGCGPGMQTVALAKALDGPVTAVDLFPEYLEALRARASAAGVADRIKTVAGDMTALPFAAGCFDLIWAEGSAYIMGVTDALAAWKRLLRPGGFFAFTELVWLRPDPPAEVAAFFADEYPAMTDIEGVSATIRAGGYALLGQFTLPGSAWWDHYYGPLAAKLPALDRTYAGDDDALGVIESTRREIEMRRRFPEWYGYAFFVGRSAA